MTAVTTQRDNSTAAIVFAVFAIACVVAFLVFRGSDVGQLSKLVGNLGGGPITGEDAKGAFGIVLVCPLLWAWMGLGRQLFGFLGITPDSNTSVFLIMAILAGLGAAAWSFVWFFLGLAGLLYTPVAIAAVAVGCVLVVVRIAPKKTESTENTEPAEWWKGRSIAQWLLIALGMAPVVLALFASAAPPVAKDSLLYHFALPKAFITQHSNAFVDGNIASYLSLGTETLATWAMLLGNIVGPRAGEAAAGVSVFLFFPLLLLASYGVARESGVSRTGSLIVTAVVATVPSAYHVATSGYIDLSLALYVTLATYALTRWWNERSWGWAVLIAVFLGAALSVKLTAVFVFAAFALIILLRSRETGAAQIEGSVATSLRGPGTAIATGFGALLLAGLIASPWYIRTWVATGSPVFPFYMSIWPGKATGWDVERSNLFQAMNSQYGGADVNKLNYLTAPVRVSVAAQPEEPANYDGVLGVAFLMGLPLLGYALWKLEMPVEIKIMTAVAGIMYLFWLFSSEQLRYLLPIVSMLAIAIVASAEKIGGRIANVAQLSLVAASLCGLLTIFAWFCQKAPLRVVLGGETRDAYLARNLDYYPYYQTLNTETPPDAKVWLINMRRDTYNIDRPVVSDYLFEDWTLRDMVWHSRSVEELRAKAATLNVQYVLARHDFLFDYDRSTLVDDKRPRAENQAKLAMTKSFLLDPTRVVRSDDKFSLVKVF
jgi:hypothetical protein